VIKGHSETRSDEAGSIVVNPYSESGGVSKKLVKVRRFPSILGHLL
jgi:hypothetical protein